MRYFDRGGHGRQSPDHHAAAIFEEVTARAMQPEADETWPDLRPLDYQTQELAAHPVTRSRQLPGQGSGADLGLERLQRGFENQLFELVRRQAQTGGLLQPMLRRLTHVEAIAPCALVDADGAQRAARLIEDQA